MTNLEDMLVRDLTDAEVKSLAHDRDRRARDAYAAKLAAERKEREARWEIEDTAYAGTFGLTYDQYEEVGWHYMDNYENRY